jgi:hypothetical protein
MTDAERLCLRKTLRVAHAALDAALDAANKASQLATKTTSKDTLATRNRAAQAVLEANKACHLALDAVLDNVHKRGTYGDQVPARPASSSRRGDGRDDEGMAGTPPSSLGKKRSKALVAGMPKRR